MRLILQAILPKLTQIMVIYVGVGGTNSGILAPDELSGFNGFGTSFDMLLNEYSTSTHRNIFYRDF